MTGRAPLRRWQVVCLALAATACGCRSRKALLPRGEGAAVVVVPGEGEEPLAGARASANDVTEQEPNDGTPQAQVLAFHSGAANEEKRIVATLLGPKDVDLYRLSVPAPQAAEVNVDAAAAVASGPVLVVSASVAAMGGTQPPPGLRVGVFEGEANTTWLTGVAGAEAWRAPNLALSPGRDVVLRIGSAPAKSGFPVPYEVRLSARLHQPGEEQEPNGTAAQATQLEARVATAEAAGTLGWRDDLDWYRVTFAAPLEDARLRLEVQLPEAAQAQAALADASGNVIKGYERAASGKLVLADVVPPAASEVWVRVQSAHAAVPDARYRVTVTASPAVPGQETEPNDLPTNANKLTARGLRGVLHPVRDVDHIEVCPPFAAVAVRAPERLAVMAKVISPTGQVLTEEQITSVATVSWPAADGPACQLVELREKSGKRSDSLHSWEASPSAP